MGLCALKARAASVYRLRGAKHLTGLTFPRVSNPNLEFTRTYQGEATKLGEPHQKAAETQRTREGCVLMLAYTHSSELSKA